MPRKDRSPGSNRVDNRKILNPLTNRMISVKSSTYRELVTKGLVAPLPEHSNLKDLSRPLYRIVPHHVEESESSSDEDEA